MKTAWLVQGFLEYYKVLNYLVFQNLNKLVCSLTGLER